MLTRDSVTVAVDAVVYYRIKEPLNAVVRVADYRSVLNIYKYKINILVYHGVLVYQFNWVPFLLVKKNYLISSL